MNRMILIALAGFAYAGLPALAEDMAPTKTIQTAKGQALADIKGKTLYMFDKDTETASNCTGGCALLWPPLMAIGKATASGDWTVISRDNGKQWAYRGHPLYRFSKDVKSGDTSGDGIGGLWHIAAP